MKLKNQIKDSLANLKNPSVNSLTALIDHQFEQIDSYEELTEAEKSLIDKKSFEEFFE